MYNKDTHTSPSPPHPADPPSPASTFHLVLRLVVSPLRGRRRRRRHHPPSRHHPRRRMVDIPLLLATSRPKVVATNT